MRKILSATLAGVTLAASLAATAADARDHRVYSGQRYYGGRYAQPYYGGRYYYRDRNDDDGAAIAAGIVGLALGAALASSSNNRYYDNGYYNGGYYNRGYSGYYDGGYYGPGYGYYARPRSCRTTSYWDPYYGGYVRRQSCW